MNGSRCWIELSRSNLIFNIRQLEEYLPHHEKSIAIVKANGYGHGAVFMASVMEENGISDFGVAAISEAEELRHNGIRGTILILSYVDEWDWKRAYDCDAIMTVVSPDHACHLSEWAVKNNLRVKVEIKVDTGMRRLGVNSECSDEEIRKIYTLHNLNIIGTYTHLCSGDSFAEEDIEFTRLQDRRFAGFIARIKGLGFDPGRTHLSASSGFLNYPEFHYDYVRPGFVLYGYDVGKVHKKYDRRPVLSLYSRVEYVKDVEAGEGISYGRIYFTDKKRRIATVSAGYADGYPRNLSGKSEVLIRGQRAPIVGRICMDQLMIDVTDIPGVDVEDKVTLIGTDGNETITLEELAALGETVPSEIVCRIPPRVTRYPVD